MATKLTTSRRAAAGQLLVNVIAARLCDLDADRPVAERWGKPGFDALVERLSRVAREFDRCHWALWQVHFFVARHTEGPRDGVLLSG